MGLVINHAKMWFSSVSKVSENPLKKKRKLIRALGSMLLNDVLHLLLFLI